MPSTSNNLTILEKVDSTNNYAMALVQQGVAVSGEGIFARQQTAGRGRRGKAWQSTTNESVILSINRQMQWLPLQQQFRLSIAVALGCCDFFSGYTKEKIKIKWPNDIFINDRKAGGILIENVIKGNLWQWAVIGIGLNINQESFEPGLHAVSLRQLTGGGNDVIELAHELLHCVTKRINQLETADFDTMLNEYNTSLFCRNKIVKLRKGNIVFETKVKCVTSIGELITEDSMERKFTFDEVEWQIL
jgi:BirA family transcriptional regulator, biotin operon repressor / biotin---[acetyl-CoA-carboxylase] ligase